MKSLSLLSLLLVAGCATIWFGKTSKLDTGSAILTDQQVISFLNSYHIVAGTEKGKYLVLQEVKFKTLVAKYKDTSHFNYDDKELEFQNCVDYSRVVFSEVLVGAAREHFRYAPSFFLISLTEKEKRNGVHLRHMMNLVIVLRGTTLHILGYEPQDGHWKELDDMDDVKSFDYAEG